MEEKKLLRVLNYTIALTIFLAQICQANENYQWANGLRDSTVGEVWDHLNKQFSEQVNLEGIENINIPSSKLFVFVSSSMPLSLLKTYAQEALKYNATLIFKGLPNSSFNELTKLIIQLKDGNGEVANASIDDQAFELFSIDTVPVIVLAEEPAFHPNQTPHAKFDKITGNVGIKYALEQFESSGEIREEAGKHLKGAKRD